MSARKVAARFAAHAWYQECHKGEHSPAETAKFVRENWSLFLPVAHEGWGRLLLRITSPRSGERRRRSACTPSLAAAG